MIPGSPFWDAFLGVGVVTMVIFFIFIIIQSIIEDNRSNKEKTERDDYE